MWEFKLVGLTSGFPYQMVPVYQKVQYIQIPNVGVRENPGFSVVVGVSAIKSLFSIK
jgi:hypothetical protein